MKRTLLRILKAKKAKLYRVRDGQRDFEFIENIEIHLYEEENRVLRLGNKEPLKINNRVSIVITEPLDEPFRYGDGFSLELDLKRNDGIFERVFIHNIEPININVNGNWEFEMDHDSLNWVRFL